MREEIVEARLAAEAVAQWVSSKQRRGGTLLRGWGCGGVAFPLCLPGSGCKGFWVYIPRYSWLLTASEGGWVSVKIIKNIHAVHSQLQLEIQMRNHMTGKQGSVSCLRKIISYRYFETAVGEADDA